jgi:sugar phosphate isomerase/epimerase
MKIGVMNDPSASVCEEIISFGKARYDFVDLTMEGPNALDFDIKRARVILEQYELAIVGHTDPCLPYAYPIKSIREVCLTELQRCAGMFAELGAEVMNIHACYACPPGMKQDLVALNIEALKPIVEMADSLGLTVAFENFKAPFDSVSMYKSLLQEVPGLRVHLDFGHTNLGIDDAQTLCLALGSHIAHVHFSDNRSANDDHMPLGVGNVDWKRAVSALKSIGYDGTITLEVFCDDRSVLFQYLDVSKKFLLDLWNKTE